MSIRTFHPAWLLVLLFISCYFGKCFNEVIAAREVPKQPSSCTLGCNKPPITHEKCGCNEQVKVKKCPDVLWNMNRYEYIRLADKIIRSGDRNAQNAYDDCVFNFAPKKSVDRYKKCSDELVGPYCGPAFHDRITENPLLLLGIYDCVTEHIEYTLKEKKQLLLYEYCFTAIKVTPKRKD